MSALRDAIARAMRDEFGTDWWTSEMRVAVDVVLAEAQRAIEAMPWDVDTCRPDVLDVLAALAGDTAIAATSTMADENYAIAWGNGRDAGLEDALATIKALPPGMLRSAHATDYLPQFLDRAEALAVLAALAEEQA